MDNNLINKCSFKLLGIHDQLMIYEEKALLEALTQYVTPIEIVGLVYDFHKKCYFVFLIDLDAASQIIGKHITFNSYQVEVIPMLDYYIIYNVHPSLSNDELRDIFSNFGNVYDVREMKILPNHQRFSHILSGKREISFLLEGDKRDLGLPPNIFSLPYCFHTKKLCCACYSEGHSFLTCPDVEGREETNYDDSEPAIPFKAPKIEPE